MSELKALVPSADTVVCEASPRPGVLDAASELKPLAEGSPLSSPATFAAVLGGKCK
jgi:hypothetical protein